MNKVALISGIETSQESLAIVRGIKMLKYLLLPPVVLVAGCASVGSYSSNYVDQSLTKHQAKLVASDFIGNIKRSLPPATTTLLIKKNDTVDNFTPLFINLLRQNEYNVIYTDQPQKQKNMGVNLSYRIRLNNRAIVSLLQYNVAGEPRAHISTRPR
ncbi:conjugal transfer protein TrbH [Bartonella vinsonii]|uniref:Conjugal transfer protein TrbH n=2 Tax=Bartonella vinsonii TaxID=33047 RepID=A0A3S4YXT8_BARVI|nr:conjugal transfer protein TrbH [Bartonella vinsonii]